MQPSPIATFDAAVQDLMQARGLSKQDAIRAVVREQPQLHAAYLKAVNADRPRACQGL